MLLNDNQEYIFAMLIHRDIKRYCDMIEDSYGYKREEIESAKHNLSYLINEVNGLFYKSTYYQTGIRDLIKRSIKILEI